MLKEKHDIRFNLPCVMSRIGIEGTELYNNKQQRRSSQILGCKINQRQIAKGRQKSDTWFLNPTLEVSQIRRQDSDN